MLLDRSGVKLVEQLGEYTLGSPSKEGTNLFVRMKLGTELVGWGFVIFCARGTL